MKKNHSPIIHVKGFTLIELLVVIAIIGILSTLVVTQLTGARAKARDAQRKSNLVEMGKAIEVYATDFEVYPSTGGGYWGETPGYGSHPRTGINGYIPDLAPKYMNLLPHDPRTGIPPTSGPCVGNTDHPNYVYVSNGTNFKVMAHCTNESYPDLNDSLYDPRRPTWSFQVSTPDFAMW